MNQKQLADVLIKILGLSFCVDGMVRVISGVLSFFVSLTSRNNFGSGYANYFWTTPLIGLVVGIIGILFIVLSKSIAKTLFKDE